MSLRDLQELPGDGGTPVPGGAPKPEPVSAEAHSGTAFDLHTVRFGSASGLFVPRSSGGADCQRCLVHDGNDRTAQRIMSPVRCRTGSFREPIPGRIGRVFSYELGEQIRNGVANLFSLTRNRRFLLE